MIVSGQGGNMVGMEQTSVPKPPLDAALATRLLARVRFGDSGVGGFPLDGDLALAVGHGESWQGKISNSALDAVRGMWVSRARGGRASCEDAVAVTKAVLEYDAEFLGVIIVDWETARIEVLDDGTAVRVAADVRSATLPDADTRRAMVRLEIVDGTVTFAEWVLTDGDEISVLEQEELEPAEHDSPSIDSMTWFALASLGAGLERRGLPPASSWQMAYDHNPALGSAGWCAELRVWTVFSRP